MLFNQGFYSLIFRKRMNEAVRDWIAETCVGNTKREANACEKRLK